MTGTVEKPSASKSFETGYSHRRNGDFAAAARYLGIGIEQRCKELGYASAEKFVAALERQQEFGDVGEVLGLAHALDTLANVQRLLLKRRKSNATDELDPAVDSSLHDAKIAANQSFAIHQALLHLNPSSSTTSSIPSIHELKKLVAQSKTTLSLLHYACDEANEARKLHREALEIFAEIQPKSSARRKSFGETNKDKSRQSGLRDRYRNLNSAKSCLHILDEASSQSWETFKTKRRTMESIIASAVNDSAKDEDESWKEWKAFRASRARRMMNQKKSAATGKAGKEGDAQPSLAFIEQLASAAALKSLKDSLPPKLLAGGSREVHGRTSQSLPQLAHSSKETTKAAATDSCEGRKFPSPNRFCLECLGDLSGSKPEDNIPARIELDPTVADVIIFGRLPLNEQKKESKSASEVEQEENAKEEKEEIIESAQHRYKNVRLDCSVHERLISRRHAMLKFTRMHRLVPMPKAKVGEASSPASNQPQYDWAWVLRDLDSTNGILVNGVRVKEHPLQPNDVVSFGGAATVAFGCSVQTHKRKPVSSVFVYKFTECRPAENTGKEESLTSSVQSVTFRRTHFELLFSNIVNECFKRGPTGVDQLRTTLEWRNKCEEMYARAKEEHVPLVHWTGWIKAKLSAEHLLASAT